MKPIGLQVSSAGRALARAFDDALVQAGGSLPTWLVLLSLKQQRWRTQQELAQAVGIQSPTLTRHLDKLDAAGLIARRRDPDDRRIVLVELTSSGEQLFHRLRRAATAFDQQLREGFSDRELELLSQLLERLKSNVAV